MRVEIRPLDIPRFHKKAGKESFKRPMVVEALYDETTGGYATGLTEEERVKYEGLMGVNLSPMFNPLEPHPFYSTKAGMITLPNNTMILETSNPRDFVKWKLLKASKFVANSMKEYENGIWPSATHVIFDEEEEVAVKASKAQRKQKAYALLADMSVDQKSALVEILVGKTVRGRKADFIDAEVSDIAETRPEEFIKWANMDKKELFTRAAILEGIHRNILTKEGNAIFYMGDRIADEFEQAVTYFMDPQNQQLKVMLLDKLK